MWITYYTYNAYNFNAGHNDINSANTDSSSFSKSWRYKMLQDHYIFSIQSKQKHSHDVNKPV